MRLESFIFSFFVSADLYKDKTRTFSQHQKNKKTTPTPKTSSRENQFPIFHFAERLISLDTKAQQKSNLSLARCFF